MNELLPQRAIQTIAPKPGSEKRKFLEAQHQPSQGNEPLMEALQAQGLLGECTLLCSKKKPPCAR